MCVLRVSVARRNSSSLITPEQLKVIEMYIDQHLGYRSDDDDEEEEEEEIG